jgi:amino acid permease
LIIATIAIGLIIRSTLAGAIQRKNVQSVYIKILLNHIQLIVLTASFDFDWPTSVLAIFETTGPVANVATQVFSFDCFLDRRSENDGAGEDSNIIRIYYQKMVMYAVLPLLLALG